MVSLIGFGDATYVDIEPCNEVESHATGCLAMQQGMEPGYGTGVWNQGIEPEYGTGLRDIEPGYRIWIHITICNEVTGYR